MENRRKGDKLRANYSMTGYARAEGEALGMRVTVEMKSVNHRYLDLKLRLARQLQIFEPKVSELCRGKLGRGRVELWANLDPGDAPVNVKFNRPLAQGLLKALNRMKQELGLAGEPDLALLAREKDVILIDDTKAWGDEAWNELGPVFENALASLLEMRAREGRILAEDLSARLDAMEALLESLEDKAGGVVALYKKKLDKRIGELLGNGAGIEPERLAHETALFADRSDITEEMVRFKSHLGQFRETLSAPGPKGRKLDFLCQEFFREINTASNKAQDAEVSGLAVEIKTVLEKVREQVQNLE